MQKFENNPRKLPKQDDQFEVQSEKSVRLTQGMVCSNVLENCVFFHWNACFVATIVFPLGVNHLNNTKLYNLKKKYIPTVLNKWGCFLVHIYTQAMVFDPVTHGGLGGIDLHIEQGIMIVTEVMRTSRTPPWSEYFRNLPLDVSACIRPLKTTTRIFRLK